MVGFIDDHRGEHGVEPICDVLPIAPSTYYDHLAKRADPARRSDRARRDEELRPEIQRVFEDNLSVYGMHKVWHQLRREGFDVARCTVARLMKDMGIQGIIRGKPHRTTIPDKKQPCPMDKVNRQFRVPAPNMLCDRRVIRVTGYRIAGCPKFNQKSITVSSYITAAQESGYCRVISDKDLSKSTCSRAYRHLIIVPSEFHEDSHFLRRRKLSID